MTLEELLRGVDVITTLDADSRNKEIRRLTFDSRNASDGDVFVAIKGHGADGHSYIPTLAGRRLSAIVVEDMPADAEKYFPTIFVAVDQTHKALGQMASNFYGRPSEQLMLIGVTGTNGKTTTATLIYEMALAMGVKSGLLSTVANYIDRRKIAATHTTPDPISLNALLREMVDSGCRLAAMEVSSHAAHQQRIAGLKFAGGVFTNLTRDHLDYHNTFAAYRDAKKMFFDALGNDAFALTNIDDPNGMFMVQNTGARIATYSLRSSADFETRIMSRYLDGTLISINGTEIETLFLGTYNIYNLTAVYGTMLLSGFDKSETLVRLSAMHPVAGRFQTLRGDNGTLAIVDYAHTPDALENILKAINELRNKQSRLITVFGAGGNRDKGKRPEMGKIAAALSDYVIVTSDNPRFENPLEIIKDIVDGIPGDSLTRVSVQSDRREAIRNAMAIANDSDIVLIAGKGHEDYQEVKGIKHHFDDMEEARQALGHSKGK